MWETLGDVWASYAENRGAVAGLFVFLFLVAVAVFAPLIAPHAPERAEHCRPPPAAGLAAGRQPRLSARHRRGRPRHPLAAHLRCRYSLFIGLVVVVLSLVSGIALGLVAGYFGGWVDIVIMRVMDVILAFPSLLLALVLVAILGPGLDNAMIAIALVLQPHFVRLTRGSVMTERGKDYVQAVRTAGAGPIRIMLKTILPNCVAPLIVQATLSFSNAILEGRRARLPRHGRAAADPRMGHHARRGAGIHPARLVGSSPSPASPF